MGCRKNALKVDGPECSGGEEKAQGEKKTSTHSHGRGGFLLAEGRGEGVECRALGQKPA